VDAGRIAQAAIRRGVALIKRALARAYERLGPRDAQTAVVAQIQLFDRSVPIIHQHEGQVDKFVGAGPLAVFGALRRQADHADRALAAAREIEGAVDEEFGGELSIGIGLNSGTVVAGNVGGGGRPEFSVIGDAVKVAARVEAADRKTGDVVLLDENVGSLLRDGAVDLEERPGMELKGKSQAATLYAPRRAESRRGSEGRDPVRERNDAGLVS